MPRLSQLSFTGGELAPAMRARHDLAKVKVGLARCQNFIVGVHGGAKNRPGTKFVGEVKDSTKKVRLIPFEFSTVQTYALELGDRYMRVHKDGGSVLEPAFSITTNPTATVPVVIGATGHDFVDGEEVVVKDSGMTEINGRRFIVEASVPGVTFNLKDEDGRTRSTGAGGEVARIFTLVTPWLEADLFALTYVQNADTMTVTHPGYQPHDITRTDHHIWTATPITFQSNVPRPTNVVFDAKTSTALKFDYQVTTVAKETGEESLPASSVSGQTGGTVPTNLISGWHTVTWKPPLTGSAFSVTAATATVDPVLTTSVAHGLSEGDKVWTASFAGGNWGVAGNINDMVFVVGIVTEFTLVLRGLDASGFLVYTGGGTIQESAADKHNIYMFDSKTGLYGFIGSSNTHSFNNSNIAAETTDNPPSNRNPFEAGADSWPGAVSYFQQRKVFGGSNSLPQTIWMTQAGALNNMGVSTPLRDDDAITFTIAAGQVNRIKHITALQDLLVMTTGGEWRAFGDQDNLVSPLSVDIRPQQFRGSGDVPPLVVGNSVLFVQRSGCTVRDLTFDLATDGYTGNDLSILADHLCASGRTLVDWTSTEEPDHVVWVVRSDGVLLSLSYLREHQVFGWGRHDTDGQFESVCSVPEGNADAVYFVVKRSIGGVTKRFVERLESRDYGDDVSDAFFVDSGLSLDVPIVVSGATATSPVVVTLPTGHGLVNTDLVDINLVVGLLSPDHVTANLARDPDDQIVSSLNGMRYKLKNVGATTAELTDQYDDSNIDALLWTDYVEGGFARKAVTTVSNLSHLEGKTVNVLANASFVGGHLVVGGKITLAQPASRIHAGLGYTSRLETLDLIYNAPGGTSKGTFKKVESVVVEVESSRGFIAGPDFLSELREAKWRSTEDWNEPTRPLTGEARLVLAQKWTPGGRVALAQESPLPLHVLGITMEVGTGE